MVNNQLYTTTENITYKRLFTLIHYTCQCNSNFSRVRAVHEKTDRAQNPILRPQFRPKLQDTTDHTTHHQKLITR